MTIAVLTVLGLCMGSFINALVWRLRQQENKKQYSILSGRSICPHCKHALAPKDLMPVLSWLFLRGKCRYCGKSISTQYPLIEFTTAVLFIISYIYWPHDLAGASLVAFIFWLASLIGLIALAVYDVRWMILPNKIIFPLYFLVAGSILIQSIMLSEYDLIITSLWGVLVGGGIFYLLFQASGGKWIGGGDVKLGFLLGAIVGGPIPAFLVLFIASVLGSIFSLPLIFKNRIGAKAKIAFGPFLIVATVITYLWGKGIINLYNNLLML